MRTLEEIIQAGKIVQADIDSELSSVSVEDTARFDAAVHELLAKCMHVIPPEIAALYYHGSVAKRGEEVTEYTLWFKKEGVLAPFKAIIRDENGFMDGEEIECEVFKPYIDYADRNKPTYNRAGNYTADAFTWEHAVYLAAQSQAEMDRLMLAYTQQQEAIRHRSEVKERSDALTSRENLVDLAEAAGDEGDFMLHIECIKALIMLNNK